MTEGAENEDRSGDPASGPTKPGPIGGDGADTGLGAEEAPIPIEASPWEVWDQPLGRRPLRRLPSIAWGAVRFVWAADRRSLLLTAINDVANGLLSGVQVLVVAVLLSRLLGDDDPAAAARATAPWIAAYAGLRAAAGVFGAVVRGRADLFQERVGHASSLRLMTAASDVDLLAFEAPRFYDRLQRVQSQSQFRPTQVVHSLSQLASGVAGSVGVLIALAVIQPLLVPIALLWFLPLLAATHRNVLTNYDFVRGQSPLERRRSYIAGLLTDRFTAKEVRAFGLRQFLLDRYQTLWHEREQELHVVTRRKTRTIVEAEVSTALLAAIVSGTLIWLFARGSFTVAEMGAVLNGLWQIQMRFGAMAWSSAGLLEAVVFLDDQAELLVMAAGEAQHRPTGPAPAGFERITVDGVSFRYPEQATDALTDVELSIGRGEVVALVGENGSGKTTLAKLLGLLHTPTSGRICWDATDAATIDPDQLRRQVTVVFQDFARYNLTAAENIGLGDVDRLDDRDEIEHAATRAGADRLVGRLPHRYDTVLGRMFDAGAELSVGQWQRIAVSRAFFRDAPLLILDEPTASLDARAEHDLFERIRTLFAGRTVLLISHRFSTVRSADRIYVLHQGRVVEHGAHAELMAAKGRYAELFTLQAQAYTDDLPHGQQAERLTKSGDDVGRSNEFY